jgi:hypothetical protein
MIAKMDGANGHAESGGDDRVPVYSIHNVPITEERTPYINGKNSKLPHAGTHARLALLLRRLLTVNSGCTCKPRSVRGNTSRQHARRLGKEALAPNRPATTLRLL